MQENNNKAIVVNTSILYIQLAVTIVAGLLTTRFALKALGVDDFGLFSVVGGIISFISIVNTIMLSTSNRYIAVAIGRGDMVEVNKQFNVNLVIHAAIGITVLFIAFPLGHWYIYHYVSYFGDINNVITLFDITIVGTIISVIGVPYNGVLVARERFLFFSIISNGKNVLKIPLAFYLQYWAGNRLMLYGIGVTGLEAAPTMAYILYCYTCFHDVVRIKVVKEWRRYGEMLAFSVWVGLGAITYIAKGSGSALMVNLFFTSAMNAALGVANTVNTTLANFATNATKSISPQITKCYAAGNKERSENLVCLASKVSFMVTLLVVSPFLIAPEYLFGIWLEEVPDYAILFATLMIIDTLIGVLNAGVPDIILASGNIKWFQIIDNSVRLLSVLVGFLVLKSGAPAYSLYLVYIVYTAFSVVLRQVMLKKMVNFNTKRIIKESFIPSLVVILAYLPVLLLKFSKLHPLVLIMIDIIYVAALIYQLGLSRNEKSYVKSIVRKWLVNK